MTGSLAAADVNCGVVEVRVDHLASQVAEQAVGNLGLSGNTVRRA